MMDLMMERKESHHPTYVKYTSNITRAVPIRVKIPALPKELTLIKKIPSFLTVRFYGPSDQIHFESSDFEIVLENPNPTVGDNLYRTILRPGPPPGIRASYPSEVGLEIDRVFFRELSVIPDLKISLKKGFRLGYVSANPHTIILKGPYETLASMDHISTKKLLGKDVDDVISRQLLLQKLPDFVGFAPNQPFQVEVTANILPAEIENNTFIPSRPVKCINETKGISVQILGNSQVDIYVNGKIKASDQNRFQAFVFCPVFFDLQNKTLRPSFLIQNHPIFVIDQLGLQDSQILRVEPPRVSLQFKWDGGIPSVPSSNPSSK